MKFRMKQLSLMLSVMFVSNLTFAQSWLDLKEKGANYYDIKKDFLTKHADKLAQIKNGVGSTEKAEKEGKHDQTFKDMMQFYRWAEFVEPRVRESNGDFSAMNEGMFKAIQKQGKLTSNTIESRAASWTQIGPLNTPTGGGNGRINAVRVHPTTPTTLFACSPAGGLWKSTNSGASWTAISNSIAAVGATDLAFDPSNPDIMYLATGDGEAADVFTLGLYKSTDGGTSWNPTNLIFSLSNAKTISKILVNPTNGNNIIVGGRAGIYRTTDGGTTWTQVMAGGIRDLEFNPSNPNVVYAGGYGANSGFWRSADNGATWTKNASSMASVQRIAIAVSPLNSAYVYCLAATTTGYGFEGLYLSTDSGVTFTKKSSTPNILGWYNGTSSQSDNVDGQGWYDLSLAVSPSNINTITTGGVNIWQSTNGGGTWTKKTAWDAANGASNYVHADIHDLTFGGSTLYSGNDGGVFKSTDGGTSWSDISSNLAISQMYGLGLSTSNPSIIISGHQDNGTNLTTNLSSWSEVNGGDGMLCFIDRTNNANMFSSIYNGNLYRSTNTGGSFTKVYTVPGGGWVTPWLQDPVTATTLYAAGSNVYKSTNSGTSWAAISSLSGGTGNTIEFIALDVAKTNPQTIYGAAYIYNSSTGAAVGYKVYKTTNGGTAWTDVTGTLPAGVAILGLHIDVNDANKVYVGLASYTGNSVYLTTNGATSWTNISAGLNSVPVNCFITQNGAAGVVYCGTDLGVYYSNNSGSTWQAFTNGMPGIPVRDLEIYYATNKLRAATFAQGIWESNLNGVNAAPAVSITAPTNGSVIPAPADITITANASDSDGTVANVEFYNGTTLLGSDNTAPYSFTWTGVAAGSYSLTAKAYDNNNASSTSTVVSITVAVANDAGISAIATPNGTISTASFTPSVTLKNFGSNTLTSATILSKVDNGTETTYNWTGSLASGATANVTLAAVTGYTAGAHTFTARTSTPNATTDGNAANDATTASFTYSNCSNLNETADNSPTTAPTLAPNSSISSQIATGTDNDYYKLTTTTAAPKIKLTLTNLPKNYSLALYASKTNGSIGSLLTSSVLAGTADETIIYNSATTGKLYYVRVLPATSTEFSTTSCYTLTANTSSTNYIINPTASRSEIELPKTLNDIIVYPNPATDNINFSFLATTVSKATYSVFDVSGKMVINAEIDVTDGLNGDEINTSSLRNGLYILKVVNENSELTTKFMIQK